MCSEIYNIKDAPKDGMKILLYSPDLLHPVISSWVKAPFYDVELQSNWRINRKRLKEGEKPYHFNQFAYIPQR